ncbi:unnamed protein product [Gordionus sp. m RMFG-2023]
MKEFIVILFLLILSNYFSNFIIHAVKIYPYGPDKGDEVLDKGDDRSSREIKSSVPFPFFDKIYRTLFVNTNGIISFSKPVIQYTPQPFPLKKSSLSVIAPYWTDIDTNLNHGKVLARQTTEKKELEDFTKDIKDSFPTYKNFKAFWALIATWDKVTFYGGNETSPTNTFQASLVTNGRHSFVIFNYPQLLWTTGTASAGNSLGLGGRPAMAGFNAGDGKKYFALPGSRTEKILDISKSSNVKTPGNWIFKVDDNKIINGGCNTKGTLVLQPAQGSMLGGNVIKITGPCFNKPKVKTSKRADQSDNNKMQDEGDKSNQIKCMMGNEVVDAKLDEETDTVSCITTSFPGAGQIPIFLSIDNGQTFPFYGIYNSISPENIKPAINRRNMLNWTHTPEGPYIMQWEPLSLPDVENVDIDLMGYKEEKGKFVPKFYPIAHDVPNNGYFYIDPWRVEYRAHDIKVGALRVTPKREREDDIEIHGWCNVK